MGQLASAKSTSCDLSTETLFLDIGMTLEFNFVSNVLSYCPKCKSLTTEPRFNSPTQIRAAIKHPAESRPEAAHLAHLADAIATAIERKCRTCGTRQKAVRYSERSAYPFKCPRCSKKTLRIEPSGVWD